MNNWQSLFKLQKFNFPELNSEILAPGLSVLLSFDKKNIAEYLIREIQAWVDIIEINGSAIKGITSDLDEEKSETIVEFQKENILRIRGDLQWNINNLQISCSEKVFYHEPIGYFYNAMFDSPLHYGRKFYSISEIESDKRDIKMYNIPLKELLKNDQSVLSCLGLFGYYGFLKKANGDFDELTEEDISMKNNRIFPCTYEVERNVK